LGKRVLPGAGESDMKNYAKFDELRPKLEKQYENVVLPVFRKKIKFHSPPWYRGSSGSGRISPPYFGNALPARAFTA